MLFVKITNEQQQKKITLSIRNEKKNSVILQQKNFYENGYVFII